MIEFPANGPDWNHCCPSRAVKPWTIVQSKANTVRSGITASELADKLTSFWALSFRLSAIGTVRRDRSWVELLDNEFGTWRSWRSRYNKSRLSRAAPIFCCKPKLIVRKELFTADPGNASWRGASRSVRLVSGRGAIPRFSSWSYWNWKLVVGLSLVVNCVPYLVCPGTKLTVALFAKPVSALL